ncbi:hypothetical protein FA15DRAFT_631167 [Coprinopsis marcescibilis]|uniref:Small ribosomal subunit protein mS38 n=1 Tax=Coprinopsis marcescibilis TaxID=230819 RepID=A0A5C3LN71_COPMA|nr:hypothetical protein FA15DRAFT_631167 [Coprinopsis marcescibilis]
MSAFRHILGALPAGRRSYSSFFSSKPGGGRYFNSAKSKSPVVAAKTTNGSNDSAVKDSSSTATVSQDGTSSNGPQESTTMADTQTPSPDVTVVGSSSPSPSTALAQHTQLHPVLTSKDFKLHQFFSLHRPLLLVHNPASLFTPGPSFDSVFTVSGQVKLGQEASGQQTRQPSSVFDDFPTDTSIDADAEAARQLARGLTMNRAAPAIAWEDTLRRLGLDPQQDPERVSMQEQMDRDWEDVQIVLDSTKRKRRKKMKKHKLKKRRKATRASRLKLK